MRNSLTPGLVQHDAVFDAYARYLTRFVDEYAARGIAVWAMTVQNEPHVAGQFLFTYPSMGYAGSDEASVAEEGRERPERAEHPHFHSGQRAVEQIQTVRTSSDTGAVVGTMPADLAHPRWVNALEV